MAGIGTLAISAIEWSWPDDTYTVSMGRAGREKQVLERVRTAVVATLAGRNPNTWL